MKHARKKILAFVLVFTLVFSFTFSLNTFAEDEESDDTETVDVVTEDDNSGGSAADEGEGGLVGHWKFDGDLKDSSGFNNNGVNIGKITYTDAIFGKGAKFDGKSYIEVADSDSLDLMDAFTLSFWVYKEARKTTSDGVPFIAKMYDEGYYCPYGMYEWWSMSPGVFFASETESDDVNSEQKLDINKWALVTSTYDGKTMKVFINDELVKTELIDTTLYASSQPLYIGMSNFMTKDWYLKGVMDDLRIYSKALTYEEVGGLYEDGLAADGKDRLVKPKKLVALYKFDGDGKDISGFGNNGSLINAKGGIKFVDGIAGKAAKFNGASYFEVQDSDSLDLDNGFTIGGWIYEDVRDQMQPILTKNGSSNDYQYASYSLYNSYGSGPEIDLIDIQDAEEEWFSAGKEVSTGRWYYYTATYNGEKITVYLDGNQVQTAAYEKTIAHSCLPLWIGTNGKEYFKGMMDEIRIYNYALTPAEVKNIYKLKDQLQVAAADKKTVLTTLKVKQNVQLAANVQTYTYTPPVDKETAGKDTFKTVNVTNTATYKSSNAKVFTVSKTGQITTVGKGTATLTVIYGSLSLNTTVTVK